MWDIWLGPLIHDWRAAPFLHLNAADSGEAAVSLYDGDIQSDALLLIREVCYVMEFQEHSPDGLERMLGDARARGLKVEVISRPPAGSLPEAAALMGLEINEIIKSLVIKHKDGTFFFALIPGGRTISWPKLRALLGVNKLSLSRPEVALAATGYERGTITPLGSTTSWPVIVDASISPGRVVLGAGAHGHSAFMDSAQLIQALGAQVADISEME